MRNSSSKRVFLFLFLLAFITFSFKDRVYSKTETDTTGIPVESNPRGIAINPITDIAVIPNEKADSVSIINLNTQTVISTIPVGKAPRGVAIDKGLNLAVIGNSHDNTISIIDLNTYQVTATIPVGKEPEGITINQATHCAYAANHKDDTVSVIDLTNNSVIRTIPVGQEPKDIAIDPELNLALVVNEKDYNVSVIDLNTNQVTGTVPTGQKPQAIGINPETHIAAVINEKDNSITIINLLNWQTTVIPVGKHPIAVAINQLDNRALVVCDEDRVLQLIDLNTNAIIKTYPLEKLSRGIAVNNFTNIAGIVDDKTDSLTLIQLPNPVPEITSINPETVLRGSSGEAINIQGNKFITTSSVSFLSVTPYTLHAEFIDNHNLQVNIPKDLLKQAGTYQITITNPSPEGGTSNPANLQINNPVPSISAIDPLETKAGTQLLTLTIYGIGFFEDTEIYFWNTRKPITYLSPTKLQIQLTAEDLKTAGLYEIKAYNLPPGGGNSNKFTFTVKPSLEINITSPLDNETISKAKIIVKGTFKSETNDIGVKVNGILANIKGNEWVAGNIPLNIGANIITATATDSYGNTDTKTITINTNDVTQAVELSSNITSGIAPLQVYFSASTYGITPASYNFDFNGDGRIDYISKSPDSMSFYIEAPDNIEMHTSNAQINGVVEIPNATIKINDTPITITNSKTFSKNIFLNEGINPINITVSASGEQITKDINVNVTPTLIIDVPNQVTTSSSIVTINGTSEKQGITVEINGENAALDSNGGFTKSVQLESSVTTINIKATDALGNKTERSIMVNYSPQGIYNYIKVAISPDNELYGASRVWTGNYVNSKIDKITASGELVPVTAISNFSISSIAFNRAGELFIAGYDSSTRAHKILKLREGGLETFADITIYPLDIAVHPFSQILYISTYDAIYSINDRGSATLVANLSSITWDWIIYSLAFDPSGNLFALTYYGDEIVKVPSGGTASLFVQLSGIYGRSITTDLSGNIYLIDDTDNESNIRKITPEGNISTVTSVNKNIYRFNSVVIDDNGSLIAVTTNKNLLKIGQDGKIDYYIPPQQNTQPFYVDLRIKEGLISTTTYVTVNIKSSKTPISYTYRSSGLFYPTVTVTDDKGKTYTDTIVINVMDKAEIEALLKGKWEGMKGALVSKNIQKASSYFIGWAKERYSGLFTALGDRLPQVAQDMQNIKMIYLRGSVAKYRIRRMEAAGEITYYIYFVKDENGLWKIQQF